jgi:hypothetical protein
LKSILKYIYCIYRKIDISPLDRSASSFRSIIFLVWGINALIFLTVDFLPQLDSVSQTTEQGISKNTLELSSADVHPDVNITFYKAELGTISSYDVYYYDSEKCSIEHGRSPPL